MTQAALPEARPSQRAGGVAKRFRTGVAAGAVAIVLLAGGLGWSSYDSVYRAIDAEVRTVSALAARDAEVLLNATELVLQRLVERAQRADWTDGRLAARADAELQTLRAMLPDSFRISIFDRTGRLRASSRGGETVASSAHDRSYFQAHVGADRGLFVSEITPSLVDGRPVLVLSRRVSGPDGAFEGVVTASFEPRALGARYRSLEPVPDGAAILWIGADGRELVREPAAPETAAAAPGDSARVTWLRQAGAYPLHVAVELPRGEIVEAWLWSVAPYLAVAAAMAAGLLRSTGRALAWARAEDRYRQRLADALAQREMLLREVNHRVKNSLQLVASLLQIQAALAPEGAARRQLEATGTRVVAVARVHELLHRADRVDVVDALDYLQALGAELRHSVRSDAGGWRVDVRGDPLELPVDRAITLGLVVNELVTNAFKHGRPTRPGACARVEVRLERVDGRTARLTVRDHGPGLPEGGWQRRPGGLGLDLLHSLCDQLGGELAASDAGPGARFALSFRTGP